MTTCTQPLVVGEVVIQIIDIEDEDNDSLCGDLDGQQLGNVIVTESSFAADDFCGDENAPISLVGYPDQGIYTWTCEGMALGESCSVSVLDEQMTCEDLEILRPSDTVAPGSDVQALYFADRAGVDVSMDVT